MSNLQLEVNVTDRTMATSIVRLNQLFSANDIDILVFEPYFSFPYPLTLVKNMVLMLISHTCQIPPGPDTANSQTGSSIVIQGEVQGCPHSPRAVDTAWIHVSIPPECLPSFNPWVALAQMMPISLGVTIPG